jgi:hypothetical protein
MLEMQSTTSGGSMKQAVKILYITPSLLLFTPTMLTACHSHVHPPEEVGVYEYKAGDIVTGQSCFSLAKDGTYSLGDAGDPLGQLALTDTPHEGHWRLHEDKDGQQLILNDSVLPIERTSSTVRVKVNEALRIYCELPQQ